MVQSTYCIVQRGKCRGIGEAACTRSGAESVGVGRGKVPGISEDDD